VATLIECDNGRLGYREILATALNGAWRSPRGLATYDAGHVTIVFDDVRDMLPTKLGRNLSLKIAAVEALQLIAGLPAEQLLLAIAPQFQRYARPDGTFWGSYGRRIGQQLDAVYRKLRADPETRQAVITLWDPDLDNKSGESDYPCTVALGFSINVHDQLDMHTTMRSNDAWLGLPYDIFQFTQLQWSLANTLGVSPGTYTHTTWSLHLYADNRDDAMKIVTNEQLRVPTLERECLGIGHIGDPIHVVRDRAAAILTGEMIARMTKTEEWYVEQLADYFKR